MVLLRHFHRAPLRVMRLQRRKSMMRIRFSMIRLKTALSQETEETKQMLRIYQHYVTGHVSKEELLFANQQLADVLRATGLGIFAILPFAPVTIPLIVKLGRKLGIEVMPSAFAPKVSKVEAKTLTRGNAVSPHPVIQRDTVASSTTATTILRALQNKDTNTNAKPSTSFASTAERNETRLSEIVVKPKSNIAQSTISSVANTTNNDKILKD